ncbi:ABC transporter permease [Hymenobacter nivis]|uniref:FtsX-like permease family protein n=1 Tax=Hymenobacter nivis TaxID=1850093 RepID=A0A502GU74_9BACT|nr:ABC transporter permease [Hymenobacter nivis]TPG64526.1 FtsX-like permease family protein [Hymenobacter nivis]
MIRHLFTLMWNRKRANGLLVLEILLAFVVLFGVSSLGVYLWRNYRAPLGFAYEQVWNVSLNPGGQPSRGEMLGSLQQIIQHLKATPGVAGVARSEGNTPFAFASNNGDLSAGEGARKRVCDVANYFDSSAELRAVMGLQMKAGRWFDRRDEAANSRAVVITEALRDALFAPGESPLGQVIQGPKDWKEVWKVVGVSGPYRTDGELAAPKPGVFLFVGPQDTTHALATLLVRVQPGSGAALEKKISDDIRANGPTWSSTITPLANQRRVQFKQVLTPPVIMGVVSVFLLINVALGLFGVLWLNISQRRGELGVRRAMGATAGAISGQVLGEILVLTTFGLALGLLVAMQFPLLGVLDVPTGVYLTAMGMAAAGLYLLAVGCALYPSRLAAGIQPAVALREE